MCAKLIQIFCHSSLVNNQQPVPFLIKSNQTIAFHPLQSSANFFHWHHRFRVYSNCQLFDINEESATGTSNAALACFLHQKCSHEKEVYRFEQGSNLGEPSEIFVKLVTTSRKEIQRVYVGGRGHFCETVTIDTDTLA